MSLFYAVRSPSSRLKHVTSQSVTSVLVSDLLEFVLCGALALVATALVVLLEAPDHQLDLLVALLAHLLLQLALLHTWRHDVNIDDVTM